MSDERANPHAPTERVVLDGPTYDMLVAKVVLATKDHIEADASRSRARLATVLTVGGALFIAALTGGVGFGFSTLKESLSTITDATIQQNVPNEVEAALADQLPELQRTVERNAEEAINRIVLEQIRPAREAWNKLLLRAEFREVAERLDADWIKPGEINQVIEKIMLSSSDPEIRQNEDFLRLLEKVIDHQFETSNLDSFKELENEFKSEIMESAGMLMTMTTWYGLEVVNFEVLPKDLTEGRMKAEWAELVANYQDYAEAIIAHGYPEVPLLYDIVLSCMQDQSDAVAAALISRVDNLTDSEFEYVIKLTNEILNDSVMNENSVTRLASERASTCARTYASTPGLSPRAREMLDIMILPADEEPSQEPNIIPNNGDRLEL